MNILNGIKQWLHENTGGPEERVIFVLLMTLFGSIILAGFGLIVWATGGWFLLPLVVIFAILAVLMVWLVPEDQ